MTLLHFPILKQFHLIFLNTILFTYPDYCSGGAWKLPSGKYVCFVDPAISDFKTQFEVAIMKEDPKTGMNRLCIENGLDHMIEPRTHEDAVMFTKLQHCIE